MIKSSLLALGLAVATVAQAAPTITFGGAGNPLASSVSGVTTIDFNLPGIPALPNGLNLPRSFGPVTYTGNGNVVTGSLGGITAAPPLTNTTGYLAVPSTAQQGSSGSVTITFGADYNYFGLLWGSIDAYNEIRFFDGETLVWSGNGSTVASPANGCQNCANTNRYVNFLFDGPGFDRIVLTSNGRAFESDNHAYGRVPVPATLLLFGLGFASLAWTARRRIAA